MQSSIEEARETMAATDDSTFYRALCCVTGLHGEICRPDSDLMKKLATRAELNGSLELALQRAADDLEFYHSQLALLASDPERAIATVLRVAGSDGELADVDRISVRHLADRLGVDPTRTEDVLRAVRVELGLEEAS